jgi:Zn finger protein HypA/HybF involved in hydrogenase expression
MHDISTAIKVKEDAEKLAKGRKIKGIALEIGELAPITKEELRHALSEITGWKVAITEKPAKAKCACGYEGKPKIIERLHDIVLYECPKCRKMPALLQGGDITIKDIQA